MGGRAWASAALAGVAAAWAGQLALQVGPLAGPSMDFCIYQVGVNLAWSGTSPYDLGLVRRLAADRLGVPAGAPELDAGFFLPPLTFVALAPWAAVPWPAARWVWVVTLGACGLACGLLPRLFGRAGGPWGGVVVAAVVLFNPLVQRAVSLGQTGLFVCGCVAVGQWAFGRGRPVLGAAVWAATGVKPHLAVPLLAVAWYAGGWRRAAGIAAVMAAYNVAGGLLLGDPLAVAREYVEHLGAGHKQVGFNRVTNDQVVSWNRLVLACGGPAFDLSPPLILGGFLLAGGALWAAHVRNRPAPPASWVLGAAASWGPLTAQVLGYELVLLALLAPYLLTLADHRRFADLAYLGGALAVLSVPRAAVLAAVTAAGLGGQAGLFLSYRAFALAAVAVYFLARRPVGR